MELVRALAASYLTATLSATSLAKLKSWRISSVGILRERVIPQRAAPAVILTVAVAEFVLATFLMLGIEPRETGFTATGLFLAFCGYQMAVAVKTRSLICTCAGTTRTDPASPAAVAGTGLACIIQASLACTLALSGGRPGGNLVLLTVAAWAIPLITFLAGVWRRSGRPDVDNRFPVEFASLTKVLEKNSASRLHT
jgi:hypothetical protein